MNKELLKVRKFRNAFLVSSISSKKRTKNKSHRSRNEFDRSFIGRILDIIICFLCFIGLQITFEVYCIFYIKVHSLIDFLTTIIGPDFLTFFLSGSLRVFLLKGLRQKNMYRFFSVYKNMREREKKNQENPYKNQQIVSNF